MREVKVGQKVIGNFGFVYTVTKIAPDREGREWVTSVCADGMAIAHHRLDKFIKRFGDQLPKEKPKQGELM